MIAIAERTDRRPDVLATRIAVALGLSILTACGEAATTPSHPTVPAPVPGRPSRVHALGVVSDRDPSLELRAVAFHRSSAPLVLVGTREVVDVRRRAASGWASLRYDTSGGAAWLAGVAPIPRGDLAVLAGRQ